MLSMRRTPRRSLLLAAAAVFFAAFAFIFATPKLALAANYCYDREDGQLLIRARDNCDAEGSALGTYYYYKSGTTAPYQFENRNPNAGENTIINVLSCSSPQSGQLENGDPISITFVENFQWRFPQCPDEGRPPQENDTNRVIRVSVGLNFGETSPDRVLNTMTVNLLSGDTAAGTIELQATGTSEVDSSGALYEGRFTNVNAGNYQVCVPIIDQCKDVLKAAGSATSVSFDAEIDVELISVESGNTTEQNCENIGGLGWIMCPLLFAADSGLNWLDTQIQRLLEIDETAYTSSGIQQTWKNIRNIAFLVLLPITLVMVIGTAFGLNAVNAYTVKRAMPRLVIATIFISLSYTICTFLIGFFNALGAGALGLITAPFGNEVDKLSLTTLFGGEGEIVQTFLAQGALSLGMVIAIWLYWAPLLLLAATALLILLLRQMFIVALLLVAPLAILAWIFPGNDKLWKLWTNSFSKLLMMFPLIMVIIGIGRIFAYIIDAEDAGFIQGVIIGPLMTVGAYILPYAMIPFTFKLAGGIFGTLTGMVNDREKGIFDRMRKGRSEKLERNVGRPLLQKRANTAGRLQDMASRRGRVGAWALRRAASGVGGYNIEAAWSARNAQVSKELNEQIATGRDDSIRGLAALDAYKKAQRGKTAVVRQLQSGEYVDAAGNTVSMDDQSILARVDKTGKRQYRSAGGAWVDEAAVLEGQQRWGNDHFAQQAALSYEMRKALTDDEVGAIPNRYVGLAEAWGMNARERDGAWIGAGFENQNQHLEFKNMSYDKTTGTMKLDRKKFAREAYEKKGTYQLSQMSAHTISQLKAAYDEARGAGDIETIKMVQAVAENFMARGGAHGIAGLQHDAEGNVTGQAPPTPAQLSNLPPGVSPEAFFQVNSQGASHVAQAVRDLAVHVGVYKPDIDSPKTRSDHPPVGPKPPVDIDRLT